MNKYQRLAINIAAIDTLLMLLFPPFSSQPLARGMQPGFDGYYPVFSQLGTAAIHSELLVLQLIFVAINALSAWLVLQTKIHHDIPDVCLQ